MWALSREGKERYGRESGGREVLYTNKINIDHVFFQ